MAIKSVGEIWDGRRASIDELYVRRYTRTFRIITTLPTDGVQLGVMLSASDPNTGLTIPTLGQGWTDGTNQDAGARCYRIDPQQDQDDPVAWKVVCEYTSEPPSGTSRNPALFVQAGNNVLAQPPEVDFDYETYLKAVECDIYGVSIVNSANCPFDPPIQIDSHRLVLRIEWNDTFYDPVAALSLVDSINNDVWLGFPAYSCKIRKWGGKVSYKDNLTYFRRSVEIEFRPIVTGPSGPDQSQQGFLFPVQDKGYQVLNIAAGKLDNPIDSNTRSYPNGILLNGAGLQLPLGAAAVYLGPLHLYNEVAFGDLNIPDISGLMGTDDPQ